MFESQSAVFSVWEKMVDHDVKMGDAEGGVHMKMDGLYLGLEFLLFELSRFTLFWSH